MSTQAPPTPDANPMIPAGTVLADWNAAVPAESEYLVKAWVDNNAASGVALDLNQQRPEGPPEKPDDKPGEGPPEPELQVGMWSGLGMTDDYPGLPHSRYQSADLTFVDPPDHEEDYAALAGLREQLAAQAH